MKAADIMEVFVSSIDEKIRDEWKHEAYILGWSSDHANFEIDGKEYCLILKEVREGEHWSLKKEEANENESCT